LPVETCEIVPIPEESYFSVDFSHYQRIKEASSGRGTGGG